MSYFIKHGNSFRVAASQSLDVYEQLPAQNYVVKQDDRGQLYLECIDNFTLPEKIYGNSTKYTERIINTFLSRPTSTGVMLTGEKGSGKTLLTKNISITLAGMNIPTIVVNSPFRGDEFNTMLQTIQQPCAIIFDEFEKVYDLEHQPQILTLLDGVFNSKKLFLLTCNDKWRVDQHMRNRPGRIFYMLDFKGLDETFIREYCQDNLHYPEYTEKICTIAALFSQFNFDMLACLLEEINRYGEPPQNVLDMLNIKPEFDNGSLFSTVIWHKGKEVSREETGFRGNPLSDKVRISFDPDANNPDSDWIDHTFTHEHLESVDIKNGQFIFVDNKAEIRAILSRRVEKQFNFMAF
jgi:hypothetical protein